MNLNKEILIEVSDAYKKYPKSEYILKGLSMSIPKGNIYTLLGPSGCGKTTLLNCFVGLHKLNKGFINMPAIKKPSDFSYMPQDVAIDTKCTLKEIFYIYGLMLGIDQDTVNKRLIFLKSTLQLPDDDRITATFSGGQQRRVSLAITLLNDADTLILDEPTVGLDPLLTSYIWDYFQDIVKNQNKTIIITTHYIDEAKYSDKIGFMRNGIMLREGHPTRLMEQYCCANLDDVFLVLCKNDLTNIVNKDMSININESKDTTSYTYQPEPFNFNRFKAQAYKDYLWNKRNTVLLVFMILLPVFEAILFSTAVGNDPIGLKVGLFAEETSLMDPNSICSKQTYQRYGDPYYYQSNCSTPIALSCKLYKELQHHFDVVLYDNLETAINDVYTNAIWGTIHLTSNYSQGVMAKIIDGVDISRSDLDDSLAYIQLDMSSYIIGYYMQDKMREAVEELYKYTYKSCEPDIDDRITEKPITINKFYQGKESVGARGELAPLLLGFSFYFAITYISSALSDDKGIELMNRNKIIGVTFLEVLAGHLAIGFFVLTYQKLSMLAILYVGYQYMFNGSLTLVLITMYLVEIVGLAFGVLLSKMMKSTIPLSTSILFLTFAIFFLGGCLWPEEGMERTLWKIRIYTPAQLAVKTLRHIIIKDFGFTHPHVYIGMLSCIIWAGIVIVLIYIVDILKAKGMFASI